MSHLDALSNMAPALPREVTLKTDLLRSGVRLESAFGSRHYHHHDERGQRAAPTFQWMSRRTSHGTAMATVFTPSLGGACGPIAAFLLRHCEFTVNDEECAFCSWVRMGKSSDMRPDRDEMRETLEAIAGEQRGIGYLAFSGGSLFNRTKEADAFLAYMQAARASGLRLPPTVAAIQALESR